MHNVKIKLNWTDVGIILEEDERIEDFDTI
jgi:hypothetical protein